MEIASIVSRLRVAAIARAVGAVPLLLSGCTRPLTYPAYYSPPPQRPSGTLRAGFARVEITPPPGGGLMGYGPEGYRSEGHRQRLYARVLAVEDARGERYAFVALDLNGVSDALHREAAKALSGDSIRIGVDRLIMGATHTHSAPSHFYGHRAYDELGSDVPGFDAALLHLLVDRTQQAVRRAFGTMRPAKMAWGIDSIWGVTRIRDYPAYLLNPSDSRERLKSRFSPPLRLLPREAGVDATWWMLRVDTLDGRSGQFAVAGAMSIFAIHDTGIPGTLDLYDSDIHGAVSRLVERRLSKPGSPPYAPNAVHVFFNSSEGDTSPNVDPATRCPTPMLVRTPVSRGPRDAGTRTTWITVPHDTAARRTCAATAIDEVERVAGALSERAIALHESLARRMSDTLSLQRAFATVHAGRGAAGASLCPPIEGVAGVIGAEDGYARIRWNWPLLFSDSTTDPPLPAARRTPSSEASGCQAEKRKFLGPFTGLLVGQRPLPDAAQLSVVRFGGMTLVSVPGEATTHTAWTIRRAVADVVAGANSSADSVAIVGLTNGYSHYFASPYEYPKQFYEGGGTEFGPQTAPALAKAARELALSLGTSSPFPADTVTGTFAPAKTKDIIDWEPAPANVDRETIRRSMRRRKERDSIVIDWQGEAPLRYYSGNGPSAFFEERSGGSWRLLAWDDLTSVETRISRRNEAVHYRVTWRTHRSVAQGSRFRLITSTGEICLDLTTGDAGSCGP